jgi:hypothetical protein
MHRRPLAHDDSPSHHDLFSAVFITNTADSEFSAHTGVDLARGIENKQLPAVTSAVLWRLRNTYGFYSTDRLIIEDVSEVSLTMFAREEFEFV